MTDIPLILIYNPPSDSKYRIPEEILMNFIDENITEHILPKGKNINLIGDFNSPIVNWDLFPACQTTDYPQLMQFPVDPVFEQGIDFP